MENLTFSNYSRIAVLLLTTTFTLASCTKKYDEQFGCTAQYSFPSLNFQVVNETDLTLPVYTTADIKIYLKNFVNKTDTISPIIKNVSGQKCLSFDLRRANKVDTCYMQIGKLKLDTLVYAVSTIENPCSQPYISRVAINKQPAINIAPNAIVEINKK